MKFSFREILVLYKYAYINYNTQQHPYFITAQNCCNIMQDYWCNSNYAYNYYNCNTSYTSSIRLEEKYLS